MNASVDLQCCIQMHFVQIEFRFVSLASTSVFLLLHILFGWQTVRRTHTQRRGTRHSPIPSKQLECAPEVPIDVPLKALIKFSQSNQIILKSLSLPFVSPPRRSGSRTVAPSFGNRSASRSRKSPTPARPATRSPM